MPCEQCACHRYVLPEMNVYRHEVAVDHSENVIVERDGQARLYRGDSLGVIGAAREKRLTLRERVAQMMAIIASYDDVEVLDGRVSDQVVIWCDLNDEQRAIEQALRSAGLSFSSVHGSLDIEETERRLDEWRERRTFALVGKPVMLGQGLNLQQCNKAIFVGLTHKFNAFIQACHRVQRFGQTRTVDTHIIYAESEREVIATLDRKWADHRKLTTTMSKIIRDHGLSQASIDEALKRSLGIDRVEVSGDGWLYANNDCVVETAAMEAESVDLIVTSIPFSNHYEYTPSLNDFGHTDDNEHFWAQMGFLTPELLRVLRPGRMYCCHVKDRVLPNSQTGDGMYTSSPFHAEAILHGIRHGFHYMGMITVETDVVTENKQSNRLGWSENAKDSTKMGVGSPEYILIFRKQQSDTSRAYADVPVAKSKADYTRARWQLDAHAKWRSSGDRHLSAEDLLALPSQAQKRLWDQYSLDTIYDYESHVRISEAIDGIGKLPAHFMLLAPRSKHPDIWDDVIRMHTANTAQAQAGREKHICLARGSLVLTRGGGYKPIEEVVVGEMVLTHRGRWRPVIAKENTGVQPVVTVRAQGVPGLTLTPDHKLWARRIRQRRGGVAASADWVRADEMLGAYANLKLPPVETDDDRDAGHWWTVGRWLADGHAGIRGDELYVSCGRHELTDLTARLGRRAGAVQDTGTALQIRLRDRDGALRRTIKGCGLGAAGKHLPPEAFTLAAEPAEALLDGYMSGDGHFVASRRRWAASSVSRELLLGMAIVAQRVHGTVASVYAGRPPRQAVIAGRIVSCRQDWVLSFDAPADRRKQPFIDDEGAWKRVRSVEPAREVETWNLRVAEDESFTAEGCIVKNCPLQFDIVDRLIGRYSNPGELVFDPFAGLATVPVRAIRAGRRGRGVELNAGYFLDGVKFLQVEERKRGMPTLFDLDPAEVAS